MNFSRDLSELKFGFINCHMFQSTSNWIFYNNPEIFDAHCSRSEIIDSMESLKKFFYWPLQPHTLSMVITGQTVYCSSKSSLFLFLQQLLATTTCKHSSSVAVSYSKSKLNYNTLRNILLLVSLNVFSKDIGRLQL